MSENTNGEKYEFTGETKEKHGIVLRRIRAIKDFAAVSKFEKYEARRKARSAAKDALRVAALALLCIFAALMVTVNILVIRALAEGEAFAPEAAEALSEKASAPEHEADGLEYRPDAAECLFAVGLPPRAGGDGSDDSRPAPEGIERFFAPGEIELLERVAAAEARGEPYEGIIAAAEVALNRAALWDMTLTEVLTAPSQFAAPYAGEPPDGVKRAVADALAGIRVFDAPVTHFHEASATPYWAASKTFAGRIGNHKFYY